MDDVLKVGMADMKVAKAPQRLLTSGLGSCIGICLYDPLSKVGGLAHIMLPDSSMAKVPNKAKYADSAIPELIRQMQLLGAVRNRIIAKIAGGAQMFVFATTNDIMKVGERNASAVIAKLKEEKIPILVCETGGNFGRTIEFNLTDGRLFIRTLDKGESVR